MSGETSEDRNATAPRGVSYTYRPSLMGAPWEFEVGPDTLNWQVGRRAGQVRYEDIKRIRMAYRPVTMVSHRFLTEVWADGAPKLPISSTSWKSMIEQERQDAPYRAFVVALHEKIAEKGGKVMLESGSPAILYWPGVAIFVALALGMAALTVRGLQTGAYGGAAFVCGFFLLFMWQVGSFFRRNRPARYSANALRAEVLPN